jgi:GTPase involved in cell partitioning and DNA repair
MKLCLFTRYTCLLGTSCKYSNVRLLSTKINSKKVEQNLSNPNEKLVKVAVIGVPNAGKSTFINNLINHRVRPLHSMLRNTQTQELGNFFYFPGLSHIQQSPHHPQLVEGNHRAPKLANRSLRHTRPGVAE